MLWYYLWFDFVFTMDRWLHCFLLPLTLNYSATSQSSPYSISWITYLWWNCRNIWLPVVMSKSQLWVITLTVLFYRWFSSYLFNLQSSLTSIPPSLVKKQNIWKKMKRKRITILDYNWLLPAILFLLLFHSFLDQDVNSFAFPLTCFNYFPSNLFS